MNTVMFMKWCEDENFTEELKHQLEMLQIDLTKSNQRFRYVSGVSFEPIMVIVNKFLNVYPELRSFIKGKHNE